MSVADQYHKLTRLRPNGVNEVALAPSARSTTTFNSDSASSGIHGTANNLLLVSVTTGAGDNSLTATVASSYDSLGRVAGVDGPLSGTADTTDYRYNQAGETVGVISPDPDGSGSLQRRAVRTTIGGSGLVTKYVRNSEGRLEMNPTTQLTGLVEGWIGQGLRLTWAKYCLE